MIKECGLKSETKGKNKEKCVNRAIVPDTFYLGPQHTLGVFSGEMLDDRIEGFGADLISKHSHVSVGLRSRVSGY